MNKLIYDDKDRVNQWLCDQIGWDHPLYPNNSFNAVGVEDGNGKLIGGFAFESFKKNARCTIHCAGIGKAWCSRRLLNFVFDYIFNVANCKVTIALIDGENKDCIKFSRKLGFITKTVIEDGNGNSDLVVMTMHKNNCKWI